MLKSKKILAIVLLLIVAAPILIFSAFLVKQKLIQYEMEENLENASLQTITVNGKDIQWLKKDKEAVIEGKLFDIKSYRIKNEQIILTGLFDRDEDNLHEQLKNFVQQKNETGGTANHLVIKLIFPPLYNNPALAFCLNPGIIPLHHFLSYNEEIVAPKYLSLITPPPKYG